jgi:hypothetical protein
MAIWGNRDRESADETSAEVAPAGEPGPGSGRVPADAAAPPVSEAPAGTDAPAPVLDEDVVVLDSEAAVKDPALTETARDPDETARERAVTQAPPTVTAAPSPDGARAPAAAASRGWADSPGSISPQRWSEILAAFVDDPRGAVKMAADAVDSAIEEVMASARARQQALASFWQGGETDTEQLRIALREYRRFGAQVRQMRPEEPARPGAAAAS